MRGLVVMILLSTELCACGTGSSEQLGTGIASYDALRTSQAQCQARGGSIKLQTNGDPAELSDYSCVIPGAK